MRRKPITRHPSPVTPLIAVTAGEPAGIGPDLCVALARVRLPARVVLVADRDLLRSRARALHAAVSIFEFDAGKTTALRGTLAVRHVALASPVVAGKTDPANSAYVLRSLEIAADGCREGVFDAMVTAPVHKGAINDAGIAFTGHTEYLAAHTGTRHVVMMLVGGGMRVALATTHLALKDVARHITRLSLEQTARVPAPRSNATLRHRPAAHRSSRPQSALGRVRLSGARGNRDHRAGARAAARGRIRARRPVAR